MSFRTRPERKTEVITTRLETDLADRLRELAKDVENTVSSEVRIAVLRHVEKEEAAA